jgi:hypothetical protein
MRKTFFMMAGSKFGLGGLLLAIFLLVMTPVQAASSARIFTLSADDWARPRSGAIIPQLQPVKLAIDYWDASTDAQILLSHPGEDSGEIWAAELRDWLISLGVPSDYITLSPGLQAQDEIRILVGSREELDR